MTTTERFDSSMKRATELLQSGFSTKTAQSLAREAATRAFAAAREGVHSVCQSIEREQRTEAQNDLYWDLPSYPHEWRVKHAQAIREHLPAAADLIPLLEAAVELAARIKATPIVKKEKAPVVIKEGDKTQQRGHCQCCGKLQAVRGAVAKHGYKIKHGFFNGVCPGHAHKPMEQDRAETDRVAAAMDRAALEAKQTADKLRAGKIRPVSVQTGYGADAKTIPFAEASPSEQHQAVQSAIWNNESRARNLPRMAEDLRALAGRVFGQPLVVVKV